MRHAPSCLPPALHLAEWLYEAGIGEARAALVEHGQIVEAAIECEESGPRAGTIAEGRLVEIMTPRLQGRVTLTSGGDVFLEGIPPGLSEGRSLIVRVVRETIPEPGRSKLPKAISAPDETAPKPGPDLLARITASGHPVRLCQSHEPDMLEAAGWSEVLEEAQTGEVGFPGGVLRLSVTPAMTLFDVDGSLPAAALSLAAASAVGAAIRRHGIGGSIGVDFPTMPDKAARKAAGDALDAALSLPFERTAINGFGFLQIVRRRVRASLPENVRADPVGATLRAALRQFERDKSPGPLHLALSPAQQARLSARPEWREALAQRTGRTFVD